MKKNDNAFRHGGMTVRYAQRGLLATVCFMGLVTPVSLRAQMKEAPKLARIAYRDDMPDIFVVRFDRATMVITERSLNGVFDELDADSPLCRPAAVLVRANDVDVFQRHAVQVAKHGVVRRIFTDAPRANAWASAQCQPTRP